MKLSSIRNVAVLGLGTMGHGIAQVFATAGCAVCGYDKAPTARDSLHDRIHRNLNELVGAKLLLRCDISPILGRIQVTASESEAVEDAQFVIEAVREDLPTKQELFARLERVVSKNAILASNSSTFMISQTAGRMNRPERAIVAHWFNPPHIVPVVEVVPGPRTSDATTQMTLALLRRIGKQAIHVRAEIPGFLINRMQTALMREVWDLLDRGVASAEDLDAAVRGALGFRLAVSGQLEVGDFGGLDIHAAVFRNLAPLIKSDSQLPAVVEKLVSAGHYGAKTGRGFYRYTALSRARRQSRREKLLLSLLRLLHDGRTDARR